MVTAPLAGAREKALEPAVSYTPDKFLPQPITWLSESPTQPAAKAGCVRAYRQPVVRRLSLAPSFDFEYRSLSSGRGNSFGLGNVPSHFKSPAHAMASLVARAALRRSKTRRRSRFHIYPSPANTNHRSVFGKHQSASKTMPPQSGGSSI